jgi:ketosteroid isomerase-like protein
MTSQERIRALRAASNAALEAHDVRAFMRTIDDDYVGTAGNGGHIRSRDELEALISGLEHGPDEAEWFVRTPVEIEVDSAGGRAVETGHWLQRTRLAGVDRTGIGGRYTAYWRRIDGRWRIHGELFVTLADSGPGG